MIDYQIKFWQLLAKNSFSDNDSYGFVSGINSPFMNLLILKNQDINDFDSMLIQASNFFKKNNTKWGINIVKDKFASDLIVKLENKGFEKLIKQYEMHAEIDSLSNQKTKHNIIPVSNIEMFHTWITIDANAFGIPEENAQKYMKIMQNLFAHSPKCPKHFILYDQINGSNTAVSAATLSIFGDVARIDNIATMKKYQGKGYGSEIIQYCINQARLLGAKKMFFESSEDGLSAFYFM